MGEGNGFDAAIRVDMRSDPLLLSCVRSLITAASERFGFNAHDAGQIGLCVDEALCNIINHGYDKRTDGEITMRVWPLENPDGIRVVLEDRGKQVDLESIRPRNLEEVRPGGLGVHIIREIMDEATYEHREGGGLRLILVKHVNQSSSNSDTPRKGNGSAHE